jgi:hypothetical protein
MGLRHFETVLSRSRRLRIVFRAHDSQQLFGCSNNGCIGYADCGSILERNPAARIDGLRLTEKERVFPASRLGRCEPLQGLGLGTAGVMDTHPGGLRWQVYRERRTQNLVSRPELKCGSRECLASFGCFHALNVEILRIDDEWSVPCCGCPFDFKHSKPLQNLLPEQNIQIQEHVPYSDLIRIRIGMRIASGSGQGLSLGLG